MSLFSDIKITPKKQQVVEEKSISKESAQVQEQNSMAILRNLQ